MLFLFLTIQSEPDIIRSKNRMDLQACICMKMRHVYILSGTVFSLDFLIVTPVLCYAKLRCEPTMAVFLPLLSQ